MSNQPIIFDVQYTPYRLKKNATEKERAAHAEARAFYDMTGTKNVYRYITTEGKRAGKGANALDYLQKNTGVFNGSGMLSEEEVKKMRERVQENKGNIWHGFISLSEADSPKIDTPEKCIALVKNTFNSFFKDAKFNPDNIDLMCALHLDRPHHLHIHFVFWEKAPRYRGKDGTLQYRSKGRIDKGAIDGMFVRLGLFISERKDRLYKGRAEAIKELRAAANAGRAMTGDEEVKREIIALAKSLPKTGRLAYASKDMEPYRDRVDKIVKMLLDGNYKARRADRRFYEALEERRREIANICGQPLAFPNKNAAMEGRETLSKYHNKIDAGSIKITDEIEADYKRRQGNLVLSLARYIKPEIYERKKGRKYKANDSYMKRRLTISRRKVGTALDQFLRSFGTESENLGRGFRNRLREIEEELEKERKKEKQKQKEGEYKD